MPARPETGGEVLHLRLQIPLATVEPTWKAQDDAGSLLGARPLRETRRQIVETAVCEGVDGPGEPSFGIAEADTGAAAAVVDPEEAAVQRPFVRFDFSRWTVVPCDDLMSKST